MTRRRDVILGEFKVAFSHSHMSKSSLAKKSGICTTTIRNWETGKTRSSLISTMRMALHTMGYKIAVVPQDDRSLR